MEGKGGNGGSEEVDKREATELAKGEGEGEGRNGDREEERAKEKEQSRE